MNPEAAQASRRVNAPYYVCGLAMGLPALLISINLLSWAFVTPIALSGRADFRQLYTGGYMLRTGHAHELYDYAKEKEFEDRLVSPADIALPINHLSYEELIFAPLSLVSYRSAYLLFLVLNVGALYICYGLIASRVPNVTGLFPWFPVSLFLAFVPLTVCLFQGQDSILLLTLLSLAFVNLDKKHEFTAGVWLGLGMFKFQLVVPMALLFLLWRKWRVVAGFAMSAAAMLLISSLLVGLTAMRSYLEMMVSMSTGLTSAAEQAHYATVPQMMANLRGLSAGLLSGELSHRSVFWVVIASSLALLALATRAKPSLPIAVTASILVSYHLFIHDLSILLLPLLVCFDGCLRAGTVGEKAALLVSTITFIAPLQISFSGLHFYRVCLPILGLLVVLHDMQRLSSAATYESPGLVSEEYPVHASH